MKLNDVPALLLKGGVFMLGEYRASKAETVNYRDKLTGKAAAFSSINHVVESGDNVLTVQERVADGQDLAKFRPPFPKGQRVLLHVESLERVSGFLRATGTMSAVET